MKKIQLLPSSCFAIVKRLGLLLQLTKSLLCCKETAAALAFISPDDMFNRTRKEAAVKQRIRIYLTLEQRVGYGPEPSTIKNEPATFDPNTHTQCFTFVNSTNSGLKTAFLSKVGI